MEQLYSGKELAEILHKTVGTIRKYCNQGIIKGIRQVDGTWLIPESAVQVYLTGKQPDEKQESESQKKIQALEELTNLKKAETNLKIAKQEDELVELKLGSIAEFEKARAEFEPKRQALAELDTRLIKAQDFQNKRQAKLDARKDAIDKAWKELKELQGLYEADLMLLREFYQSVCDICRHKLPELKDFSISDDIYIGTGPIDIGLTQSDLFDEEKSEKEGE